MTSRRGWKRFIRLKQPLETVEENVDEEIRFHMEALAHRFRATGMTEEEVQAAVEARFGNPDELREDLIATSRKAHGALQRRRFLQGLGQDLRLSLRMIRKRPTFAGVVILTLALGIGANSAIFSVLRAVVLTPLPYPEADRLVTVWTPQEGSSFNPLSSPDWLDYQEESESFEAWGAYQPEAMNLSGDGDPEQVRGISLTAGVLQALGTLPARGRFFLAEETEDPPSRVAVVSDGLWKRRFGSDPQLVNSQILINRESYTVVGILPEEFRFPDWQSFWEPEVLIPISLRPETADRGGYYLRVMGRLREGHSVERAQDELRGIANRLAEAYPETNTRRTAAVVPLRTIVLGDSPGRIWILLGATGFVLLLACANVGGLLLSRNAGRSMEMAVRASIGAGRGRLARQMLTETLTLALLGGSVGLLLAWGASGVLARFIPGNLPRGGEAGIGGLVVMATLGFTLLTSLLAGVIPALATSSSQLQDTLQESPRGMTPGRSRGRLLGAMIVVQVALTFILADGAALMLQNLRRVTGFRELEEPGQVLVARYLEPPAGSEEIFTPDPFLERFLERVRGLPGVVEVGASTQLPLQGGWTHEILPEGREFDPDIDVRASHMTPASPGYLQAMGIELLRGRDLSSADLTEGTLGVVVNQTLAERSWPGESPLGKTVRSNAAEPWLVGVVVGVAEDVRQYGLESTVEPEVYLPFFPFFHPDRWLAVRTSGDPLALVPTLRATLAELDSHRPLTQAFTGVDLYDSLAGSRRVTTRLIGIFAILALALVAAGTYGVMSFLVEQRTQEMGIRIAMGAKRTHVVWQVLRTGLALTGIGLAGGILGLWGVSGVVQNLLFGMGALNPSVIVVTALGLTLVAGAAAGLPAFRATRADPVEVMRAR